MAIATSATISAYDVQKHVSIQRHTSRLQDYFLLTRLDSSILNQTYSGQGTPSSPYIIDYLPNDPSDAMAFPMSRKWSIAILNSLSTFAVTFASSVYVSGIPSIIQDFHVSGEVATLGLSLFVLGFALGPLIWAPFSEVYGRRTIFVVSYAAYTAFSVAAPFSPDITTLLVLRFFASAFGSSSMTNTGGIISDMFEKKERGLATSLFSCAPFLGPAFGPVVGGYLAEAQGWRWILGLIAILGGVVWIATTLVMRETYAPFILRCRAKALSRVTGSRYVYRIDAGQPPKSLSQELSTSFTRCFAILCLEPIVLMTSLYIAIVYGTLYMFFAGFPIVFEEARGWSQGKAGLPFIGVAVGVCLAIVAAGADSKRFVRISAVAQKERRTVQPEARLRTAMIGSVILPIGLFLFAWTTYPSVPWILPIIGAMFFACGLVMVFISFMGYLVDSYTIYAASVLAANSVLRSLFGTAFPLFTTQMYDSLGNQWASSIPAFLALGCLPFPFLFHRYGPQIRSKSRYASEAAKMMELVRRRHVAVIGAGPESQETQVV